MKKLVALALMASVALTTPAMAHQRWQQNPYHDHRGRADAGTAVAVGVAGVILGLALSNQRERDGYDQWEHLRSPYESRYFSEGCYWYQGYYYREDGYYYRDRWYQDNGYGYRHYYRNRDREYDRRRGYYRRDR
jgi:hypothetical protein